MTLKEAKKILKKEGFHIGKATRPCDISESFTEYENPTICEAMQVVCSAGYFISMEISRFKERKARLKEELEEYGNAPMPGPGEEQPEGSVSGKLKCEAKLIGPLRRLNTETLYEQPKEKKGIIYPTTSPKADFYYKHVLDEGNPALKEAASQFNDALLDEQAKKIDRLKKIIRKKNMKIEELRKESSEYLRGNVKMLGETVDLSQELCDKNEDLRLSKIREKNLTEVCQKYMKENEELKKELADKVVEKIDAQALKSAESALAWKEKVVTYKDMALAYYEKKIAEKDEVIADLGKELKATKKELEEKTQLVEIVRNASKDYCDYGVAANEFIKKLANLYVIAGNKGTISNEMFERCKNYQTYGFPANCNRETKKEIDDIARGNENKKPSLFRDDSVGAVTSQKDCSPVKDTHPTEDNPEEVKMNEILERVRKALEEGHTVSIDYDKAEEGGDQSATILECGKDIDDVFEEIKRLCLE